MDRDIPNYNPIVVGRMQQKQLHLHQQRLQNIKSFNQSRITTSAHHNSRHNTKAHQLQEDKKTQIQRTNLILFNKMLRIMKRTDHNNRTSSTVNRVNARTSVELTRIQQQNRTMYERIEKQRPTIDNRKLFEQRKKQENILRFLGKYSAHALQNTQTQSMRCDYAANRQGLNNPRRVTKVDHYLQKMQQQQKGTRYEQFQLDQQLDAEQFNTQTRVYNRSKKSYSTNHTTNQIVNKAEWLGGVQQKREGVVRRVPTSAKDIILFRCTKQLKGQQYEVKIVRSHLAYQIRATNIQEIDQTVKLILTQQTGNQLLQDNNYDYRQIVNKLTITNNRLLLSNHHTQSQHQQQPGQFAVQQFTNNTHKPLNANPSHISQQNQQDSFQNNEQTGYSPPKYAKRLDSLGVEQNENNCVQQESGDDKSVDNVCIGFEVKGQSQQKQEQDVVGQGVQKQVMESKYEQALDQQII